MDGILQCYNLFEHIELYENIESIKYIAKQWFK